MSVLRANAWPPEVSLAPGEPASLGIMVTNTSTVVDAYNVDVLGIDPAWTTIEPERLSLFPGETAVITVDLELPDDYPTANRIVTVSVVSEIDPDAFSLSEIRMEVEPVHRLSLRADPIMVNGGRKATFGLFVTNDGNAEANAVPTAIDPEALAAFRFSPSRLVVAPGETQAVRVTAKGGRAWFGQYRARTFMLGVESEVGEEFAGEKPEDILATFVQRPRIRRWMMSMMGLLSAALVFAAVLNRTFDQVVEEAKIAEDLLAEALAEEQPAGAAVPIEPASVSGGLFTSTTEEGLVAIETQLFAAEDTETPVATGVTDADGSFALGDLSEGEYKLLLSSDGIEDIWYPGVESPADALVLTVVRGEELLLVPIIVGGLPVEVSGQLDVDDPTGVTVSLIVPGVLDPDVDPVVATVALAPDGSFVLPDVPSPGEFIMVVESPGAPPVTRDVAIGAGETLPPIELSLNESGGTISGLVVDPTGQPLGGATVTATDGTTSIQTTSLTEGEVGSFSLRGLATPAQYTVTIVKEDSGTQVRSVSVENAIDEVDLGTAQLSPAAGVISGRATVDGEPARGLVVSLAGSEVDLSTPVVSQGDRAGEYRFAGIPAPGTYTLTFSGSGTIPQVRVVELDAQSGVTEVTGIDVSLTSELVTVSGLVRDDSGDPTALATVVLSSGSTNLTFLTADEPLGEFSFSNVPPGAYTLSASKTGTVPVVLLVNAAASQSPAALDLTLAAQAILNGTVGGEAFDPTTDPALTVRLFDPAQFPAGDALKTTETNENGQYQFVGLEAPKTFIVAVYATASAANPIDSAATTTEPSEEVSVNQLTVTPNTP